MEVVRTTAALTLVIGFWLPIFHAFKKIPFFKNKPEKQPDSIPAAASNNSHANASNEQETAQDMGGGRHGCGGIEKLGDDLMLNILCRLPPVTLMQHKCVSRTWRRLITQIFRCQLMRIPQQPLSGFIFRTGKFLFDPPTKCLCYLHLQLHPYHQQNLLVLENYPQIIARSLVSPLPMPSHMHHRRELVDCCNGLLLFRDVSGIMARYIVSNPTIGDCIVISGATFDSQTDTEFNAALVFDPTKSNHYKIVLIPGMSHREHNPQLRIYFSQKGQWIKTTFQLACEILRAPWVPPIYFEGMLLRLSSVTGHLVRIFPDKAGTNQVVDTIDLPDDGFVFNPNWKSECIGFCNGQLLFARLFLHQHLWIFRLECPAGGDYGSSQAADLHWMIENVIEYAFLPHSLYHYRVYTFHPEDDIVILGDVWDDEEEDRLSDARNTSLICYNYKLMKLVGKAVQSNFKVKGEEYSLFPFNRCFLPVAS